MSDAAFGSLLCGVAAFTFTSTTELVAQRRSGLAGAVVLGASAFFRLFATAGAGQLPADKARPVQFDQQWPLALDGRRQIRRSPDAVSPAVPLFEQIVGDGLDGFRDECGLAGPAMSGDQEESPDRSRLR